MIFPTNNRSSVTVGNKSTPLLESGEFGSKVQIPKNVRNLSQYGDWYLMLIEHELPEKIKQESEFDIERPILIRAVSIPNGVQDDAVLQGLEFAIDILLSSLGLRMYYLGQQELWTKVTLMDPKTCCKVNHKGCGLFKSRINSCPPRTPGVPMSFRIWSTMYEGGVKHGREYPLSHIGDRSGDPYMVYPNLRSHYITMDNVIPLGKDYKKLYKYYESGIL